MEAGFDAFLAKVVTQILTPIVTLLSLAAFAVFVWGVVEFIAGAGDEEKRSKGQKHMFWGIIGLAIIFGANGIISLLNGTLDSIR